MVTITLPLSITIPRKTKEDKVFALNLNVYRNAHHMILNDAKVRWKSIVWEAVKANGPEVWDKIFYDPSPLSFEYTVFPGTNRNSTSEMFCRSFRNSPTMP
jgi:hypothetical protein